MNKYASDRKAFDAPIRSYGQIQRYIADSYAEYMAGKYYVYATANGACVRAARRGCAPAAAGGGTPHTRCGGVAGLKLSSGGQRMDSDGVKLYCSTMAKNVADRAIQVGAGCVWLCVDSRAHAPPLSPPPAGAWGLRVLRRLHRGAALARREADRDRRRHDRGAPEEHGAGHGKIASAAVRLRVQIIDSMDREASACG
jgi:alkylation response protein AidB-like acyl-CoA dehydrogenase